MPFDISQIKNRSSAQVVAILMSGKADGSSVVEAPAVVKVGRTGSYLGYAEHVGRRYYGGESNPVDVGPLCVSFSDRASPDYVKQTGRVQGILILGVVGRKEAPEAALARLAPEAPDVREMWKRHCEEQRRHFIDSESSFREFVSGPGAF